ncbi:MAG: DUF411 domain-containing protein [DPANN group archaeon]|nr:DUF411 domain-containing protein [DPANN group archaeon]
MKWVLGLGIVLLFGVLLLAGCSAGIDRAAGPDDALLSGKITLLKSSSCGCCTGWGKYAEKQGFKVDVKIKDDLQTLKDDYRIPMEMRSCHTALIGDYFVEGHVPLEAVTKLLEEKPDIAGIALPGMPSGSPGMPGKKTESWVIYGINKDGSSFEFMTL